MVLEVLATLTRPRHLVDRVAGLLDRITDRRDNPPTPPLTPDQLWPFMNSAIQTDVTSFLAEQELMEVDDLLRRRVEGLPLNAPFGSSACAEQLLGHVAYVICRVLRPKVAVETGVALGSLTTYVLTALHKNGFGILHSIDLPALADPEARWVGAFVPMVLRDRWTLHIGASRRLLPRVLANVAPIGLFIHDSLHTKRNMRREFLTAGPHLSSPGAVLSDDVHWSCAFETWARATTSRWAAVKEVARDGWLGIAFT